MYSLLSFFGFYYIGRVQQRQSLALQEEYAEEVLTTTLPKNSS
jgi:hypothetical protein